MKKINFLLGLIFILFIPLLFSTCSKSYDNSSGGGNKPAVVYMKNSIFSNTSLQIKVGDQVTWMNDDNMTHTVTSDNAVFDSGDIAPGAVFNYTFNTAGTYAYHCKYHASMTATVIVIAGIK